MWPESASEQHVPRFANILLWVDAYPFMPMGSRPGAVAARPTRMDADGIQLGSNAASDRRPHRRTRGPNGAVGVARDSIVVFTHSYTTNEPARKRQAEKCGASASARRRGVIPVRDLPTIGEKAQRGAPKRRSGGGRA